MEAIRRAVIEAPAKINLFLEIAGQTENGYHLLDTVMQAVSLCDIVVAGVKREPGIRVTCSREEIPENADNLAYRAAELFLARTGAELRGGLHIHIDKRIPSRAGLGGGSADAAAVLIALDRLAGTALTHERLCELGLQLGADVPFMFAGGCALAEGVGELITPLSTGLRDCFIVIAKPEDGVDTREAYSRYDSLPHQEKRDSAALRAALAAGDTASAGRELYNVFRHCLPDCGISGIRDKMLASGAFGAELSGSGSAVAGLFGGRAEAEACAKSLAGGSIEAFVAVPLSHGPGIVYQD